MEEAKLGSHDEDDLFCRYWNDQWDLLWLKFSIISHRISGSIRGKASFHFKVMRKVFNLFYWFKKEVLFNFFTIISLWFLYNGYEQFSSQSTLSSLKISFFQALAVNLQIVIVPGSTKDLIGFSPNLEGLKRSPRY